MKKIIVSSLIMALVLLFNACTSSGITLQRQTPSFRNGTKDGCATAHGKYTKNHKAFKNNSEYKNGWFYGRRRCNP